MSNTADDDPDDLARIHALLAVRPGNYADMSRELDHQLSAEAIRRFIVNYPNSNPRGKTVELLKLLANSPIIEVKQTRQHMLPPLSKPLPPPAKRQALVNKVRRQLREHLRMTGQSDKVFAREIGISPHPIYNLLRGGTPYFKYVVHIENALNSKQQEAQPSQYVLHVENSQPQTTDLYAPPFAIPAPAPNPSWAPTPVKAIPPDPEVAAIAGIIEDIKDLDIPAQERALKYVLERVRMTNFATLTAGTAYPRAGKVEISNE